MPERSGRETTANSRRSILLPRAATDATVWCLDHVARGLVTLHVSANAVSLLGVALAAVGGVLLSLGHFGQAATAMVAASLGDALDGLVARRSGRASVSGALLDAAADRYEEFFFLGGLAVFFHESAPALVLALLALAGSFMVSYGSAKAEGLALPVPASAMRRAERAVCLCVGATAAAAMGWMVGKAWVPAWAPRIPLVASLAVIAVVANVSAVRRLRWLARLTPHAGAVIRSGSGSEASAPPAVVTAHHALRLP
jgi:CDP-diacylglycerol---glycerol-3-phosphate 3-phosphatidyltransferase